MAGFDPNQPRDDWGRWTVAGRAARRAAGLTPSEEIRELTYKEYREVIGNNSNSETAKEMNKEIEAEIQDSPDLQSKLSEIKRLMNRHENALVRLKDGSVWYVVYVQSDPPVLTLQNPYKKKGGLNEAFPWEIEEILSGKKE